MTYIPVNEQVSVTAMGFKKNLAAYPRQMEYRGSLYTFIDAGIRCLVRSGGRVVEIITVSDGASHYRLRSDNHGGNWTLLSIAS